jgi:hypothetical protein
MARELPDYAKNFLNYFIHYTSLYYIHHDRKIVNKSDKKILAPTKGAKNIYDTSAKI